MKPEGMTLIVRNTAKLITGFVVVFGLYTAATGHVGPGGGFAGGVIVAAAAILVVLAFGRNASARLITEPQCHTWDAAGAIGFLAVAVLGYFSGGFFVRFIPIGVAGEPASAGTIPLSNLAILVKVGAGLAGAFLALAAVRAGHDAGGKDE